MAKNEVLAATAALMTSEDYKDRFKAEYIQLKNRYEGLKRMTIIGIMVLSVSLLHALELHIIFS